jgi:hypothetical protein
MHYVRSLLNGNYRAAVVEYQQYFTELRFAKHLDYAQKPEGGWFLPMSERRTLTIA